MSNSPTIRSEPATLKTLFRPSLIICLVALEALLLSPSERVGPIWRAVEPGAHMLVFALLTWVLLGSKFVRGFVESRFKGRLYLFVFTINGMLALQTEFMQLLVSRNFELPDLAFNFVGSLITIAAHRGIQSFVNRRGDGGSPARSGFVRFATIVPAIALAMILPAKVALDHLERWRAFPVITEFRNDWEKTFLISREVVLHFAADNEKQGGEGEFGEVEIIFLAGEYPGFTVIGPMPDWDEFDSLTLSCVSTNDSALELHCSIYDGDFTGSYNDRFNRILTVNKGETNLTIPLAAIREGPRGREMDLSQIDHVTFFMYNLEDPVVLRFRRMYLH